jgi:phosphate transport system permease protein
LLISIGVVLVNEALPILRDQSIIDLLTSQTWSPTHAAFGLAPFIAGSFIVTFFAMILGVVPAVLSGIYLAEYTSSRRRSMVKPIVDLLAGIPSVVYGLWGVLFVVPLIREVIAPALGGTLGQRFPLFAVNNPSGYSVLAGAIVLAIMVFPLIVAVTDEVLRNVPLQMRESALALGATRWETTWLVVRRAGLPGIAAAIVLAFSRAFGETLAIMMVIGNTPIIPRSIFDSAYPLPALIANAYSEMMSIPQYRSALMLAALVLLVIVLIFNVLARRVICRLGAGCK